jgi:AraC family transcriptional regulator of adaptative response / DNA-3-methyladenine glycosylase II
VQVLACDLGGLGMPGARRAALVALAEATRDDATLFTGDLPLDDAVARLRSIRGVGEWTAQYIALRALRAPDAFPASDVGLLRAAAAETGVRPTPAELLARSEAWRPWRAYAAQHLWTVLASPRPGAATQ